MTETDNEVDFFFGGGSYLCSTYTCVHCTAWRTFNIRYYYLDTESLTAITRRQFSCLGVPQCWGYRCDASMSNLLCGSRELKIRSSFLHRQHSYPPATSLDPRERLHVSIYRPGKKCRNKRLVLLSVVGHSRNFSTREAKIRE